MSEDFKIMPRRKLMSGAMWKIASSYIPRNFYLIDSQLDEFQRWYEFRDQDEDLRALSS